MKKIREWISIRSVKTPKLMVLLIILAANIVFLFFAAFVIMTLELEMLDNPGFWHSVYYASTMLVSGFTSDVITEVNRADAILIIFSMICVIIGMITFTGTVIGYIAQVIFNFVEMADSNTRKLRISNHTVILNWNTCATEIINELMHKSMREKIVVLVEHDKDEILQEIKERLSDTLEIDNKEVRETALKLQPSERKKYIRKNKVSNKLMLIVREGDSWSAKQLNDISIKNAKSIIILSNGKAIAHESNDSDEVLETKEKGNASTVKTLLQVAQLISEEDSMPNQVVVVEVENDWTLKLVKTIIEQMKSRGGCKIIPVAANHILGQVFSQFALMPELNLVYNTLFSNKGVSLFTKASDDYALTETEFVSGYIKDHFEAIPLSLIHDEDGKLYRYYMSDTEQHIDNIGSFSSTRNLNVSINPNYEILDKHILILGHNSKSVAIMEGIDAFYKEWKKIDGPEVLDVTIIDSEANLEKHVCYNQYSFINKIIGADIYSSDVINNAITEFIESYRNRGSIIILSDDTVPEENIDADVLTYLVFINNIIEKQIANNPAFNPDSIDLVVEILNPRNFDILNQYSTKNIVISNRYISKMIMQISEKESIFHFYENLLDYDINDAEPLSSKELFIKRAEEFFTEIPEACTAAELIRAVYINSPENNKSLLLGYFCPKGEMTLFAGDQRKISIALTNKHKLILFSNH
ncbi:MAG: hypothetical protein FWD38_07215 [Oscillospiraceae bacterium]|nr:hypothetical protein [Oscillospiraceae bacterium]